MNRMKPWCIAIILIAALLLVGAAGAVKPEKGPLDRVVFVHYKDAAAKSSPAAPSAAAYKLWGIKWDTQDFPVTYYADPTNSQGLSPGAVNVEFAAAFEAWDESTSRELFTFGESRLPAPADGKSDVYFAPIDEPGVIAKTTVWYYRVSREIVEADIQMNSNMPWGIYEYRTGATYEDAKSFDVRNIATHEAGHVCGLSDLYKTWYSPLTMYGYGSLGEVQKDTLDAGDIVGLQKLYGG